MLESSETVVVNCTVQDAFDYLDEPQNHKRFKPSLVRSELINRSEDGKRRSILN
jgi:hypothetical protein